MEMRRHRASSQKRSTKGRPVIYFGQTPGIKSSYNVRQMWHSGVTPLVDAFRMSCF